ncbi:hypothetical protein QQ045_020703 [Rhodiola kirilowii]
MEAIAGDVEAPRKPVFRDIRRYYCEYCGLCRSKKSLIASHIRSHHQNEMDEGDDVKEGSDEDCSKCSNTCEECGASFKKPSHLKQHMLTHSGEDFIECFMKILCVCIFIKCEALDPTERTPKCTRQRMLA